jgi:methyltransferase (TIGR00027 family)
MAKTGNNSMPGTAEGAALGRALHTRLSSDPVLYDDWAIRLLSEESRERVLRETRADTMMTMQGFDTSPIFAVNVGCLRYAEDEIDRCVAAGIDQYLVLGAGLDTFALRRGDLAGKLAVFEVDHPEVQALKRARIAAADAAPAALPTFIAMDFETQRLAREVAASAFDTGRPAVTSWLNTLPYLSGDAVRDSLAELADLLAPRSRLVLNYVPDVELTPAQADFATRLLTLTDGVDEPMAGRWRPTDFEQLLTSRGFRLLEHADESVLTTRYFKGRDDGLRPGLPLRVIVAERAPA